MLFISSYIVIDMMLILLSIYILILINNDNNLIYMYPVSCTLKRQVQKSDRINSDCQSRPDQLGSTRIVTDYKKIK